MQEILDEAVPEVTLYYSSLVHRLNQLFTVTVEEQVTYDLKDQLKQSIVAVWREDYSNTGEFLALELQWEVILILFSFRTRIILLLLL